MSETNELDAAVAWGSEVGRGTVRGLHDVHRAVSGHVFTGVRVGLAGVGLRRAVPAVAPVQLLHDAISTTVYTSVRGGVGAAGLAGRGVARARPAAVPLSERPKGALVLAALAGAFGDHVEARHPALLPGTDVVVGGRPVPLEPAALAAAFPAAGSKVVVLAHGLCETERAWNLGRGERGTTYAESLAAQGWTPVVLRYATGLHISENARRVAALLDALVEAWPVDVERLALVGHSMGGLVFRSALHQHPDARWTALTSDLVTLGSPHLGARLEGWAHRTVRRLSKVPETRPLAAAIRARSVGVKDLGHGHLLDADWLGQDADGAACCPGCSALPFPAHVRHRAVAATLTRDPRHPVSRALGDLFVHVDSAHAASGSRRLPYEPDDLRHVGGISHFGLLNDARVDELLRRWLT